MIRATLLCLLATPAAAEIQAMDYAQLERLPHMTVTFDRLPQRAEPGHVLSHCLRETGVTIGERLHGQALAETVTPDGRFDALTGRPAIPLNSRAGSADRNLAIAHHRGFGSNALFPLGPDGAAQITGRGEGAVAILFDRPQWQFGLKLHADYADPLSAHPDRGHVTLRFYSADGALMATQALRPGTGVQPLAWRSDEPVRALTVTNTDPGGIALDDILFQTDAVTG